MAQDRQYVTFGIEQDVFGISVDHVKEILDPAPVSRVPQAPRHLLGLMDVRGASIPILDLKVRFGLSATQTTSKTRVIILENWAGDGAMIGIMVDCVFEVTDLGGLDLQPPPTIGRGWRSDCVTGVGRRDDTFVIVLNLERLIDTGVDVLTREVA